MAQSFAAKIKEFRKTADPDFLFAEPSEMVTTDEMRGVASMGLRDVHFDVGPVITLVDGTDFENTWAERRVLMTSQIKGADLVALSRADLLGQRRREDICGVLREHADNVIMLSVTDNLGLDCVVGLIE